MAIVTLPATLEVLHWTWGQVDTSISEYSEATGHIAARNVGGPARWTLSMASPEVMKVERAADWSNMVLALRGRVNHLAAHDFMRPTPRGTLAGTLTLNATAAAGATSAVITGGTNGQTLLKGDLVGLGTVGLGTSELVEVTADATVAAGLLTIAFEPPLRGSRAAGQAVTITKPLAYFKRNTGRTTWSGSPGQLLGGFSLDLLEQWA